MEPNKQKNAIAEAAIRCFREHGYDEVSVQMICDEAGVVRSTFYRMFSGKKEIITYLMENTDTNQIVKLEDLLIFSWPPTTGNACGSSETGICIWPWIWDPE